MDSSNLQSNNKDQSQTVPITKINEPTSATQTQAQSAAENKPNRWRRLKILVIIIVVGMIFTLGIAFIMKDVKTTDQTQTETGNKKVDILNVSINSHYWASVDHPDLLAEKIPSQLAAASKAISDQVGSDFFTKYIKYNSSSSETKISADKLTYYLTYYVSVPDKGINSKKTTKPVFITVQIKSNGEVANLTDIAKLPDCSQSANCNFVTRDDIMTLAQAEMTKDGVNQKAIQLDFNFVTNPTWQVVYDLPQDKAPTCTKTNEQDGGIVTLTIDALTKKVLKKSTTCNIKGV